QPWESIAEKYKAGERVRGTVTRLADYGAFVELEPGIEGLIQISEMSWSKGKIRKAGDVMKEGETVEVVILGVDAAQRRLSLGLKQALGDPWVDVPQRFPIGSTVEGPVTSLTKFGAFVQLSDGVEGLIHVSEISPEKRIQHPADVLRAGQVVTTLVIGREPAQRQRKLSLQQPVHTGMRQ